MVTLRPSLKTLHILAGEGNFHAYRLLRSGRRGFLFAKYITVTFSHSFRRGEEARSGTIVFVKGKNQLRYQSVLAPELEAEFGDNDVFSASRLPTREDGREFAGFTLFSTMRQIWFLALMLATGRKRYLNLYFLEFQAAIEMLVAKSFRNIKNFICFNDQPYDVAAILNALHRRGNCRSIAIQHGLILSPQFYFPSVAREFWAWGGLSEQHYRSWTSDGTIFIRGRYADDVRKKADRYLLRRTSGSLKILIAPSFSHAEAADIVRSLKSLWKDEWRDKTSIAIKFHPSTRFRRFLELRCKKYAPWLKAENAPMEALSETYDLLITKNSTSAVDFILRGKPVFFYAPHEGASYPSLDYGFPLTQLPCLIEGELIANEKDLKNTHRAAFLKAALNV